MAHIRLATVTDPPVLPLGRCHFHPCADGCGDSVLCFAADGCDTTAYVCPACQSAREDWEVQFLARSAQRGEK
jgi:hypothetical protein